MELVPTALSMRNKVARAFWNVTFAFFYRPSPIPFHFWRRFLLRCFGAKLGKRTRVYPRTKIWAPWNLVMAEDSVIADDADCYSVTRIVVGQRAIVSQYAYLCTATHDYRDPEFPLLVGPIQIGDDAWVAAGAFLAPGVNVGEGAVVGARSVVTKDVNPWTVVAGNPSRIIGDRPRTSRQDQSSSKGRDV